VLLRVDNSRYEEKSNDFSKIDFPKLPSCLRGETHRQAATSLACDTLGDIKTKRGGKMKLNFTYTKKDILKASYLKGSDNRKKARKILIPLGLFLVLITSFSRGFRSGEFIIIGASLFSISFADVILPTLSYFLTITIMYRNKDTLFTPHEMIVSDEGIIFKSKDGESLIKWSAFTKYTIGKDIILLYISKDIAFNIPKRIFTTEQQKKEFVKIIKDKIGGSNIA